METKEIVNYDNIVQLYEVSNVMNSQSWTSILHLSDLDSEEFKNILIKNSKVISYRQIKLCLCLFLIRGQGNKLEWQFLFQEVKEPEEKSKLDYTITANIVNTFLGLNTNKREVEDPNINYYCKSI